jgi:hypothetical protein
LEKIFTKSPNKKAEAAPNQIIDLVVEELISSWSIIKSKKL